MIAEKSSITCLAIKLSSALSSGYEQKEMSDRKSRGSQRGFHLPFSRKPEHLRVRRQSEAVEAHMVQISSLMAVRIHITRHIKPDGSFVGMVERR